MKTTKQKDQTNFRLDPDIKKQLLEIVEIETEKTGYKITLSSLISKILTDFARSYKK